MMHSYPRILVIGAHGQMGWELRRTLAPLGVLITAAVEPGYDVPIDLTRADSIVQVVEQSRPDIIVNAAAYTAVDKAETESALAYQVNAEALKILGELARQHQALCIHYSTDFVFSGDARQPYREDDLPGPLGVYGASKLAGEQMLLASCPHSLVLRTSWLYGVRGHNFLLTMLRLFKERDQIGVVDDQVGAPTWSRLVAEATALILYRLRNAPDPDAYYGCYHLTCGGETSWYGFAVEIAALAGHSCAIRPIPTRDYSLPARRPAYSTLDNSKISSVFGLRLPHWQTALALCYRDLQRAAQR